MRVARQRHIAMRFAVPAVALVLAGCAGGGDPAGSTVPEAPTNVQVVAGPQRVTLTWDPVTGASEYNVYLASEPGVTKDNYAGKPDGARHSAAASPVTVTGLDKGKPYYFVVTGLSAAGESTESEEVRATPSEGLTALPGEPDDAATEAIPELEFAPRPEDYTNDYPGLEGIFISFNTLLLVLELDTSVAEANNILSEMSAEIVGGVPGVADDAEGILIVRVPSQGHDGTIALIDRLEQDPRVALAVQDILLEVPEPEDALEPAVISAPGTGVPAAWSWDLRPVGGNWGLELVRVPQLWNLNTQTARAGGAAKTGVLDSGFADDHPDLRYFDNLTPGSQGSHGTFVAGFIGATFNNGLGIDGVNPFSRLVVRAVDRPSGEDRLARFHSLTQNLIVGFRDLLRAHPDIKVINVSQGYNWRGRGVNADTNARAQQFADRSGAAVVRLLRIWSSHERNPARPGVPVVVATAGNDGGRQARYNSPFSNAALEHGAANIIVVEALALDRQSPGGATLHSSSNVGGHLSAPGVRILSTSTTPAGEPTYAHGSGTSSAAPHVTGVISYLYSLELQLDLPTLAENPVLELLRTYSVNVGGGAQPRVDAFAAVMGLDRLRGTKALQQALVDVDDGTRDGNLQAKVFEDDPDPDTIHTAYQRRGDGRITMRDFRAWRDAYLQVHAAELMLDPDTPPVSLELLGPHFKTDLNFDGCSGAEVASPPHPGAAGVPVPDDCTGAPSEIVYPRYDFSGDGMIGPWYQSAPFKMDPNQTDSASQDCSNLDLSVRSPPGFLRDIDVLADPDLWNVLEVDGYAEGVFVDPAQEGIEARAAWSPRRYLLGNRDPEDAPEILKCLPDYIHSFDLHFHIDWSEVSADYRAIQITVASEMRADFAEAFEREIGVPYLQEPSTFVVTIPLWTGKVRVEASPIAAGASAPRPGDQGYVWPQTREWTDVKFGQDKGLEIPGVPEFISISAGFEHTCGVTKDTQAYCWGAGYSGQLGTGLPDSTGLGTYSELEPAPVSGDIAFASVNAGAWHTCGVTEGGQGYCWGEGGAGQLGNGARELRELEPVQVAGGLTFSAISAGEDNTCSLTTDGHAYCWGAGYAGQLGNGARELSTVPVPVAGGLAFASVSTGWYHTCGLTADGDAYCWGRGDVGQLGTGAPASTGCEVGSGSMACEPVPAKVSGGLTFAMVSAGLWHTCGVTTEGRGYCWGLGALGQLGNGAQDKQREPAPVSGGLIFAAISAEENQTCGLTTDGHAYCWGERFDGVWETSTVPVPVPGELSFEAITAGSFHACALTPEGRGYCLGGNWLGQLGNGSTTSSAEPVAVWR